MNWLYLNFREQHVCRGVDEMSMDSTKIYEPSRRTYRVLAIAICMAGAFLFFYRIGQHSFWSDELVTAEMITHESQAEIWHPRHPNMEGQAVYGCLVPYYSIAKLWASIFGNSEAGIRSFSAASALVALILLLVAGPSRLGLGYRRTLVSATLFLLSPMLLWYAQEARYYGFLQPLALIICATYFQYWKTGRLPWLLLWTAFSIFSLMAHPYMIFLITSIGFYGAAQWRRQKLRSAATMILCHGAVASVFLTMMKLLTTTYDRISKNEHSVYALYTDDLMPWKVLSNFLCGVYEHGVTATATVLGIIAIGALSVHIHSKLPSMEKQKTGHDQQSALWIAAAIGSCALMIAVSWYRPIMVEGKRYVMVFFLPFCICLGSALTSSALHRLLAPTFLSIMFMNSFFVDCDYFTRPQKQNWRMAGEIISRNARAGDAWIHQNAPRSFAAEYYASKATFTNVIWDPSDLEGQLPLPLRTARRIWLVKTGSIADQYATRLEQNDFLLSGTRKVPTGTHFLTEIWLFEAKSH